MVDATVVVAPVVVVGPTVVGVAVAMVVTGTTVSASPLHPEATKRNVRATAYCLTVSVCHPSPEAGSTNTHRDWTSEGGAGAWKNYRLRAVTPRHLCVLVPPAEGGGGDIGAPGVDTHG